MVYGLCRALPGERCTIAPVTLQMTDARTRSGRHITARLDAQTPGVRTTRFSYADRTGRVRAAIAHGCPPCDAVAPTRSASTTAHPAFVTIAIRPSDRDEVAHDYAKSEFR
jgi:hypothetical protein